MISPQSKDFSWVMSFFVLYCSSSEGKRAANLLLFKVEPRDSPRRHKSLHIHVYFVQRQREMATGKKWSEGGRKGEHFLHPLFSSDELIMQRHIFSLSLFFFPFPIQPRSLLHLLQLTIRCTLGSDPTLANRKFQNKQSLTLKILRFHCIHNQIYNLMLKQTESNTSFVIPEYFDFKLKVLFG